MVTCIGAYRHGLGRLHNPGMGFMPFVAAALLGILSLVLFIQSGLKRKEDRHPQDALSRDGMSKGIVIIVALVVYAWLVPIIGYGIATFLFMASIFKFAGIRQWWKVIVYSLLASVISYFVFSKWLSLQFPAGPWGF
jgi:putative tricarboxylic transport membrane protein